jgi:putative transposase
LFGFRLAPIKTFLKRTAQKIHSNFIRWTAPLKAVPIVNTMPDVVRSKPALIAENAFLGQQLLILNCQVTKPQFTPLDRLILVFLANLVKGWQHTLLILQPNTLLRWHHQGFKLFWKFKSTRKKARRQPRINQETIALIKKMAQENKLWGAERIQGELLKLNIKVSKRTTQKYMRQVRNSPTPTGQNWHTFLKTHSKEIWACDFLPVTNLFFKQLYAFFIIELASRRVVHVVVTYHPTQEWVAPQLKEATPFDQKPEYLIRDRDSKFGHQFDAVAKSSKIEILKTAYRTPKMNGICERFLGSVRRECLDHLFIFSGRQLLGVLKEYVAYFNTSRPHQGISQAIPGQTLAPPQANPDKDVKQQSIGVGKIIAMPILGGLHYHYAQAA